MKSIPLTSPRTITEKIKSEKLLNVTLETGNENIYIPNENKFIVTNSFLQKRVNIFYNCDRLVTINMENFDFSKIITMGWWFYGCENLSEIIFPQYTNLPHLESLSACFAKTNLSVIDLSFMKCKDTLNFEDAVYQAKAKKIVLPKCKVNNFGGSFFDCPNLEEIIAPVDIDLYKEDVLNIYTEESLLDTFYNCNNLKIVNLSDGYFNTEDFIEQITNPNNNNNLQESCVIVLQNIK